jgi:hypothetical protein
MSLAGFAPAHRVLRATRLSHVDTLGPRQQEDDSGLFYIWEHECRRIIS